MPNSYHYFESGEVSQERLDLEIELLKQLQEANLLKNLNWNEYDTSALRLFHQAGIRDVSKELIQRYGDQPKECEQNDFIEQCIRKHRLSPIKGNFKQQRISFPLILNILFIFICLSSVLGLFIYQYIKVNHQHHFTESLDRPLTTKRRHLSFTDDLVGYSSNLYFSTYSQFFDYRLQDFLEYLHSPSSLHFLSSKFIK